MKRKRSQTARDSTIRSAGLRAALIRAVKDWYDSRNADPSLPLLNDHILWVAAKKYFERRAKPTKGAGR